VRFWLRWLANGIAVFLGLYLVDSLLNGRFKLEATWAAVLAAVLLGFVDSFVRPLHRARSRPYRAAVIVALTALANVLILQIFVWVGADVSTEGLQWVVLTAAFLTLITGLINWQVGFNQKEKPRPTIRGKQAGGSSASGGRKAARG
jgi:uncharacterized membrane protein YvlD (DUF360 family)